MNTDSLGVSGYTCVNLIQLMMSSDKVEYFTPPFGKYITKLRRKRDNVFDHLIKKKKV